MLVVRHEFEPRWRRAIRRGPLTARAKRRLLLAAVLAATSVGWVGGGTSAASPPAELVSVTPGTTAPLVDDSFSPSVSGDGNIVVVNSSAFNSSLGIITYTAYVRNRANGTTATIPGLPPEFALYPGTASGVVSRDGCHVVVYGRWYFDFAAGQWNIYSWNRCAFNSAAVEIATNVQPASYSPGSLAVSADGRYVAYSTNPGSSIPPKVARIDTTTSTETVLTSLVFNSVDSLDISDDGNFVAIGAQAAAAGVIAYRVIGWTPPCAAAATCATEVISIAPNGLPASGFNANPSVSADGRYVAFVSSSPELFGSPPPSTQMYVRDRVAGVTKLVTDTPGQAMIPTGIGMGSPEISRDGTQIALTEEDQFENSQVWVARSANGFNTATFDLVSYGISGAPVPNGAGSPSMSSTGKFVAFSSSSNRELSGGSVVVLNTQTWLRTRPISLGSTPTVDFGTVDIGSQSPAKNAVITNTGAAEINLGSVTTSPGPFNITVNGCVGVLPAGASCTVTIVFQPTSVGPLSASLVVAGEGLTVTTSLTGVGRTPTGPTPGFLTIKPVSASFGSGPIGTSFPAKKFVVTNPGLSAVTIASVGLGGIDADQFAIPVNGCTGSLGPAGTCTIQVSATVLRDGTATATLDVVGTGGQSAHATLRLGGLFTPTLKMNPGVVSPGEVTAAIGEGFPPNIDVQLAFEGETPFATVHTDGEGAFRFDYLLLRNGIRIGGRQVIALDQAQFSGVRAPLLIDLATYRPSGFSSPAITSGVRSLVNRGG